MKYFVLSLFLTLSLAGCGGEHQQQIHNVPPGAWQKLTVEQKQLIIDHSFHEDLVQTK